MWTVCRSTNSPLPRVAASPRVGAICVTRSYLRLAAKARRMAGRDTWVSRLNVLGEAIFALSTMFSSITHEPTTFATIPTPTSCASSTS